jgi:PST family polysaccharide transporter
MSQAALPESRVATDARLVADTLSRAVILIGCLMFMQRGIGFLRSMYVCGALSPVEVGRWDLAFSFFTVAAPLAVLGIPGSFGRYLAHYRMRKQQGRFLHHTVAVCLVLVMLFSGLIYWLQSGVATLLMGDPSDRGIVALLAVGLPVVAFFNFAISWLTGHQLTRIVFRIQCTQSLFFAVLSVFTLQTFSMTGVSVIWAYLLSVLFALLLACSYIVYSLRMRFVTPEPQIDIDATAAIWRKILPFAVWVWINNALMNLFSICDRLLLVNFHAGSESSIQSLVGQYHTSLLFPLLLVTVGAMVGSMLTPYLSRDWEAGDHKAVVERLNLMIKVMGLACVSFATGVLVFAPLLFRGIWQDKFAIGESLLPLTLSYCSLGAMTLVAQKYFWCIERIWYSSGVLMFALLVNVCLGLTLIGPFGMQGVVASTLCAHAIALLGVLYLCSRKGMRIDRGVLVIVVSIVAICFGKWVTLLSCTAILSAAVIGEGIFSAAEKEIAILKLQRLRFRLAEVFYR